MISWFLRGAADTGEALHILGDPGVGKTLLLDVAAEMAAASGNIVLRASGVEFEADVGFIALNQLGYKLMAYLPKLAAADRAALEIALGYEVGGPPDRHVVSAAMLELLQQASVTAPVLIVIDDLPWVDRPSTEVLSFVAHRVRGNRIGFLAASRSGDESYFDRSDILEHNLAPLATAAAQELLMSRFPGLATEVRGQVLALAKGNPLALLELPTTLSGSQPGASAVLPRTMPLPRRLQTLFSARVAQLPEGVQHLLLLAALDGTGDPRVAATHRSRRGHDLLDAARRARLIYLDTATDRLVFTHPLVRASVVELSSDEEQRAAHRELAALFSDQPDRCIWHLAAAAHEPDEQLAVLLEQAAERMIGRGDSHGAVAARIRAAELSANPVARGRRLAHAAFMGVGVAGERRRASTLLLEALREDQGLRHSLEAAIASAYLLISGPGDVETAYRLLVGVIETKTQGEAALEVGLYGLMLVCFFGGRAESWEPFHQAIARLGSVLSDTLQVCAETFADPVHVSGPALDRLSGVIDGLAHEADPVRINRVAFAAAFVDRLAGCRDALDHVVNDQRPGGAVVSAILALNMLAAENFRTGWWELAEKQAAESVSLCQQHAYVLLAWPARYVQAALAVVRGDSVHARAVTEEMLKWAGPRLIRSIQRYAWQARSLGAIASGEFEDAYRYVTQITQPGRLPSHVPQVLYIAVDLVESCMRTNREAEAAAHVAAMEAADIGRISPRMQFEVTGCAAIVTPDLAAASDLFAEALAIPGAGQWPFQLARIRLLYGERLRRAGLSRESRKQLNAALQEFQRLGARPWMERAQNELRATGQNRQRAEQGTASHLTPQELRIATLAARGLPNKQIAGRLSLSEKTVASHLLRAFGKLGVTSRVGLRDALARMTRSQLTPADLESQHQLDGYRGNA